MGRYVPERRLGVGGMAEVFRARQLGAEGFSRPVALKRILPAWSEDDRFATMFIEEARVSALLVHPNIVGVLEFDRDDEGALFLAMELVDGMDLSRLREGAEAIGAPLSPEVCAFVCGEVLRALDFAHRFEHEGKPLGIVHRDVSPHNVLVSSEGAVKLGDFGIAKATARSHHSGSIKGKVAYLAPEQARGEPLDGRADLFAVGVMLYELLVGARPFAGATEAEVLAQILAGRPIPIRERAPGLPRDLAAVAMKLLASDRDRRFASAREALDALVACDCHPRHGDRALAAIVRRVAGAGPVTPASTPIPSAGRSVVVRPSRRTLWLLGLLALASAAIALVVWVPDPPPPRATTPPADAGARVVAAPAPLDAAPRAPQLDAGRAIATAPPPQDRRGLLHVKVSPWAEVIIDGRRIGPTPLRHELGAGRHTVTLLNEELPRREEVRVEIRAGKELTIERRWD